jgi:hypothetical protein
MLTVRERTAMINQITSLPLAVETAVKDLDEAQLDTRYREGGWTVRQVVHHLADSHLNAFIRMKLILTEENPTLKSYDQDTWALLADVAGTPVGESIVILKGLHARWGVLLKAQPESSWSRTAQHPETGPVTLESMLTTYARHGEKHVGQITALRTSRGW